MSQWARYDRQERTYGVLGKWHHEFTNMTDACLLAAARNPFTVDPLAEGACAQAVEINTMTGKPMTKFERENSPQ